MDRRRNYFVFRGVKYGVGTIVKIKPEQYGSGRQIARCNGIAKFKEGYESGHLSFSGIISESGYCGIAITTNPDDRIDHIIKPVYYEDKPIWQIAAENYKKTPKSCRADIMPGTVLYIAGMIVGTLFNDRITAWFLATVLYLRYLVNIYRD